MPLLKQVSRGADLYFTFRFLRLLTMKWTKTDAYKYKIIDAKGKVLRKSSELESVDEKAAYTMFHRLVYKMRRLLEKIPIIGKSILTNYAAALLLLKEQNNTRIWTDEKYLEQRLLEFLETDWEEDAKFLKEEMDNMDKKGFREFLAEEKQGHALVVDGKVVARGNKKQLLKKVKKDGIKIDHKNNFLTYTGKEVGDSWDEGIDIKKADMKDVIKDFQSSDAPQFKGKSDKKKKEMAIAAKLSSESVETNMGTKVLKFKDFTIDEKWEAGEVYHQDFKNGDRAYFRADSVQKNNRWKGMSVDEFGGKQKKAKNNTADEKTQGWKLTPKNEIPKGLKEEVEIEEKVKPAKDVGLECQECLHKFRSKNPRYGLTKCPKCKSTDLDLQFGEEVEDEGYGGTKKWKKSQEKLKRAGITHKKDKYSGYVEGVEIEEKKSYTGYELYHKSFSGAMQHAYDHAKSKGFTVDPQEIDDKVATGPRKPSSGKTNRYMLGTNGRKNVHIQVANLDNKRYELNMYIEGVELFEKWKEGTYTITDVKTGKVLGKFKSGAKAQKAADDIFQKGDYEAISVEVDEEIVYTRGVELHEVESKYGKEIAAFKAKGGKVKKLKPDKPFKSKFKKTGEKVKSPPRQEEVEEASTYRDRSREDEKDKKKKGFTPQSQKKSRWGSSGYGKGEEVEFDEGSSDTQDMYALMVKGMKAVPGSPKQKEIIKQINVIRKRMGMELMKEGLKDLPPHLQKSLKDYAKKQKKLEKEFGLKVKTFAYNPKTGKPDIEIEESLSLQATMALSDAGIKSKWKKGKLYVAKKDIKKAEKALSKSFRKGGEPDLYYENLQFSSWDEYRGEDIVYATEAFWKVDIPEMPSVFIEGSSESEIRMDMKKKLKPEVFKELTVTKVSKTDMTKMYRDMAKGEDIDEEVPTNSTAGVAGLDIGLTNKKKKADEKKARAALTKMMVGESVKMSTFAGKDVFIVDNNMFHDCRMGKRKYHRYEKYVGTRKIGQAIREYGLKYPKRPIILQNGENGPMLYLRYGGS